MTSTLVEIIKQCAAREKQRTKYPEGFPLLPLAPAGNYTDSHLFVPGREREMGTNWIFGQLSEIDGYDVTRLMVQNNGAVIS